MTKLRDAVDRFCARHPRFGIPKLMLYVAIGNVVIFLLQMLTSAKNPNALIFLTFQLSGLLKGEIWRVVTFIFFPPSTNPFFLLISVYFYYWIGSILENAWGTGRFTIYYISGVVFTLIGAVLASLITGYYSMAVAGTYYVNLSMFLAFALLYPDVRVYLLFFPVKVKWLAWVDIALFALGIISSVIRLDWAGVVLPIVALFNLLIYAWPELLRLLGIGRRKVAPQTVNFRKAVRQQEQQKGYHHKCAVCGRTDADYPELQFRYCSKCAGYHCFCQDHIFAHVHFTE